MLANPSGLTSIENCSLENIWKENNLLLWSIVQQIECICLLSQSIGFEKDLGFWPRATLKGPKRSFIVVILVLVVLVGVESSIKIQKLCMGTKKCSCKSKWRSYSSNCNGSKVLSSYYGIEWPCLPCMSLCGLEWPYVASYGLLAFQGHGHVRPNLT